MRYEGKCKAGHVFQGVLGTPKGHTAPTSFAERCPVPYCPHFITYRQKREVTMEEVNTQLVSAIYDMMDRLTTLSRRLIGVNGYEPISRKKVHKELGDIGVEIQAMRRLAVQPE